MALIKKIDKFVLAKFLLLFAGSFLVCLFVLIMQVLWSKVDDLIGKGLTLDVLGRFFWYASITLVPTALPLAILLASLIAFGNMGEQLELTAMKAAGIPLKRIMAPIFALSCLLCGTSFVFQNNISPNAQKELARLTMTMKETSPAIEIPEGVFYSGIPNVNLYVDHKNAATGMLYEVIIYKVDGGIENAQIVMADSARLETTGDKHFLLLTMYDGEQFENLQSSTRAMMHNSQVPYDRETFKYKTLLIDFDSDFDLMDAELFAGMARVKNLEELIHSHDSIVHACDSIGRVYWENLNGRYLSAGYMSEGDTARLLANVDKIGNIDSILKVPETRSSLLNNASQTINNVITDLNWERDMTTLGYRDARRHLIEWHQKFALSLGCLIFFFIGAPLGAIIRKGGLGLPTVISVLIFIIYYIINTSGMKLARDGSWNVAFGMWVSTLVLAPLGGFITYKANRDSVVFNFDSYISLFCNLFGIHPKRNLIPKEVVVHDPNYNAERQSLATLTLEIETQLTQRHWLRMPNYFNLFFRPYPDDGIETLSLQQEGIIEALANSKEKRLVASLNAFPIFNTKAHQPFKHHWVNVALGSLIPIGIFFWLRMWRFRILLHRTLKQALHAANNTNLYIDKYILKDNDTPNPNNYDQ